MKTVYRCYPKWPVQYLFGALKCSQVLHPPKPTTKSCQDTQHDATKVGNAHCHVIDQNCLCTSVWAPKIILNKNITLTLLKRSFLVSFSFSWILEVSCVFLFKKKLTNLYHLSISGVPTLKKPTNHPTKGFDSKRLQRMQITKVKTDMGNGMYLGSIGSTVSPRGWTDRHNSW